MFNIILGLVGTLVVVALLVLGFFAWLGSYPKIEFYGRIIDQHQQPVRGASVYYSISSPMFSLNIGGRGIRVTDEEGYFHIDTRGYNLVLGAATHDEIDALAYDTPRRWIDNDTVAERMSSIHFSTKESIPGRVGFGGHETKDTAYQIHAWRLTKPHQGAIARSLNGYYNADGSEYTLTLFPANRRNAPKLGRHAGQLRVSCTRPHMESNRDYGDWQLSITPIDGGLQKAEALYMNQAPLEGYQPSFEINMIEGAQDYRHSIRNQRFYFFANDGATYGSIRFDFEPFGNLKREACLIYADYRINPTGSRNLELLKKTH